ncbi:MAG: CHASE domain-containing protein [Candidatus Accumulibacter sp.]|nr:CHASE domain-containing protein [Accumulibacter sp.]
MNVPAILPAGAGGAAAQMAKGWRGLLCPPNCTAAIVFVAAATLAAGVIWRVEHARVRDARAALAVLAGERAYALQTTLDRVLSATYALAAMLEQGKGRIPRFEATAGQLLRHYPGAAALQLAPGGVVRQTVPLAGEGQAPGQELMNDPACAPAAARTREGDRVMLAGPFRLPQGVLAAAGCLPVFLDDGHGRQAFWGLVIVLVTFPDALAPARLGELGERGFAYELSRVPPGSAGKQVILASSNDELRDPVERMLPVANGSWTLRIAPTQGWSDPSGMQLKVAAGLLLSIFLAWQAAQHGRSKARARAHERTLESQLAKRTAELQRLAEVITHHLREPARRIASYAGRLRRQLAGRLDDDEVRLSLDFIAEQALRLQDRLRDVGLYLAADQARGEIAACNVERAVTALLATLADRLAEADARLTVGSLPPALIDRPRLVELFRIALDNALQHGRGEESLRITIGGERRGELVRYHVSDNGPGVEEIYRQRVFRLLERLASSGPGTGVSLAIVQRIAESAGGHAWLAETPAGGCSLYFELPAAA